MSLASRRLLFVPGLELPDGVGSQLARGQAAGVALYRHVNDGRPEAVRAFTDAIHAAAAGNGTGLPALVGTDQEGGQLIGLATATTPFAGAMATAAAGDENLAERVARATGLELRALGVTVNWAPVCDLASNPANPAMGIRSFGADPAMVGRFAAATVRGLQSAGVAATVKHFPGLGDTSVDSHIGLPVIERSREALASAELVPFRAAIAAGARLAMSAHVAVPALTGHERLAATVSRRVMHDVLRGELGFDGVSVTDALDMGAIAPADGAADVAAVLGAGVDLLLCGPDVENSEAVEQALRTIAPDALTQDERRASQARIHALRRWLAGFEQPSLDVVGSAAHQALAAELALRSITLVRDDARLLPLRPGAGDQVLVVEPRPIDRTPADTSSYVPAGGLAAAVRTRHPAARSIVVDQAPGEAEIAAVLAAAAQADLIVLGTIAALAEPAQAELARRLLDLGRPIVTVALRTPWDLGAYRAARTHLCSFGILPPSLDALVGALWGDAPMSGRLPAPIADLYPAGHGLAREAVTA